MAKVTVLTNGGEGWCVGRLAGTLATDGKYVGWGSGAGTAAKSDTTLFSEETESRATGTVSVEDTGAAAMYQVEGTLTADGSKTITNAATFTADSSGTMIMHMSWDGIALNEDDQITFTFRLDPS